MTSIEILNRVKELRDLASAAVAEERVEDAARIGGQIDELNFQLEDAIRREDEMRASNVTPLAVEPAKPWAPRNIAQAFLGPRDAFEGVEFAKDGKLSNLTDAISGLPEQWRTIEGLPALQTLENTFLRTLSQGTTDADIRYPQAKAFTNAAAPWTSGNKPESSYEWEDAVALREVIAHQTPVSVMSLKHYGQLESIISNELFVGLENAKDATALYGNNPNGIVGVTTTADTDVTFEAEDTIYDKIRRMIGKSTRNTGIRPTHVAVSPLVAEGLDLLKTDGGDYLRLTVDGRAWGLPLVQDANLDVTTTTEGTTTTASGVLVYASTAATWFTSEGNEISMGVIDKQFIQNMRTMLAEGEFALMNRHPKSFVYLADALA